MRRYMKLEEYAEDHIIDAIRDLRERFYWENDLFNDVKCELYMNIDTFETLKSIARITSYDLWYGLWRVDENSKIFDLQIKIDNKMEYLTFMIKESEKMSEIRVNANNITLTTASYPSMYTPTIRLGKCFFEEIIHDTKTPKEYYINEKKKTVVLKWNDDTITKVKVSENDKFDARYGFLIAYFQKNCGMSKTKANKYLDNLKVEIEEKKVRKTRKKKEVK